MGLKEEIKEMYRRLGVMDERVSKLQSLDIPKKGDVAKDLGKAKDQKDFDKRKKEWQTKLDKADAGVKDVDSGFDLFTDQVKKVESANSQQWQDNTKLNEIDVQITAAQDADKLMKSAGQQSPFGEVIKKLQALRQDFIDKRTQLYKEVKQETTAMWKLFDEAWPKFTKVRGGDLASEKEALKTAKFGSGAKVKAGSR